MCRSLRVDPIRPSSRRRLEPTSAPDLLVRPFFELTLAPPDLGLGVRGRSTRSKIQSPAPPAVPRPRGFFPALAGPVPRHELRLLAARRIGPDRSTLPRVPGPPP